MGKRTKSREAQRFAAEQEISALLRAHSKSKNHRLFIDTFPEFDAGYRARIEPYRAFALRQPEQWRCALRKRSPDLRFLELVRFTFARYRVAQHLENAWLSPVEEPDFRRWYIVAAQGGSLYRFAAHAYLSRVETHHFLSAPDAVGCSRRAFWYAVARAHVHRDIALRIARTRLAERSPQCSFWKDVARFLARSGTLLPEMNDLIDFFAAAHEENQGFALAGRSLPALRRHMQDWHRTLREWKIVYGATWQGIPLADADYVATGELGRAVWRCKQVKSEYDLFKEGERLHHCVLSYKDDCINGVISIWSLRCEYPPGNISRGVTLELRNGAIVECRGFANRLPYPEEVATIKHWASEHGFSWRATGS